MKDGNDPLVCGKNVFKEHLRRVRCVGKRDHSGRKEVVFSQLVGVENVERTDHIRDFVAGELIVPEIISQQRFTGSLKLAIRHLVVAIPELLSA